MDQNESGCLLLELRVLCGYKSVIVVFFQKYVFFQNFGCCFRPSQRAVVSRTRESNQGRLGTNVGTRVLSTNTAPLVSFLPDTSRWRQPRDLRLFQVSESSQEYHSHSVDLFIVARSVGKVLESFDELARRTRHKISLPFAPTPLSAASTSLVKG